MSTIFFASNPRHILMASGLALSHGGDGPNHLFVFEGFPPKSVGDYIGLLEKWDACPFRSISRLRADYTEIGGSRSKAFEPFRKRRYRRDNRRIIDREIERIRPQTIYVGTDRIYESQYTLHRGRRLCGSRGVYVEDGTAAYAQMFMDRKKHNRFLHTRHLKDLLRKLTFGPWWQHLEVLGTSSWIEDCYVAFPDLVIPDLRAKKLHRLPAELFRGEAFERFARATAEHNGLDFNRFAQADLIIPLARSTYSKYLPRYRETMHEVCRAAAAAGKQVAVKYHPRERRPEYLGIEPGEHLHVLPASVGFELLMMLVRNPRAVILGDISTALMATRWLRPELRVVALAHDLEGARASDYNLNAQFEALGIPMEADVAHIVRKHLG